MWRRTARAPAWATRSRSHGRRRELWRPLTPPSVTLGGLRLVSSVRSHCIVSPWPPPHLGLLEPTGFPAGSRRHLGGAPALLAPPRLRHSVRESDLLLSVFGRRCLVVGQKRIRTRVHSEIVDGSRDAKSRLGVETPQVSMDTCMEERTDGRGHGRLYRSHLETRPYGLFCRHHLGDSASHRGSWDRVRSLLPRHLRGERHVHFGVAQGACH